MCDISLRIDCLEETLGNLRSLLADPRFTAELDYEAMYSLLVDTGLAEEELTLDEWREMASNPERGAVLAEDMETKLAALRNQLRNQLAGHAVPLPTSSPTPPPTLPPRKPQVRSFDEVQPLATRWIWPHRVARGWLTLVAGEAGAGKSLVLIDLISRVSRGGGFPPATCHGQTTKRRPPKTRPRKARPVCCCSRATDWKTWSIRGSPRPGPT